MTTLGAYPRMELAPHEAGYPERIYDLPEAPPRLYVMGSLEAFATPLLAIIGARRPTPYGIAASELAARIAASQGLGVVSGGAMGCDRAGGVEALARGAVHVIVLGCGADVVYPRSSAHLIRDTLESGGAVVSLDPWGTPPRRYAFPRRNRIIAALSHAVFIGEAGLPSGTFTTAEAALELDREILAAPGSIFSPTSRGANQLIADGACCIVDESSMEVALSRIFGTLRGAGHASHDVPAENEREARMLRALTATPLTTDEVARLLGCDVVGAMTALGDLLIRGLVEQLPDGRYGASKTTLHAQTSFGHNG